MRKVKVIVEKTSTGYSAFAEKFPVYTTGGDVRELTNNMIEAINTIWRFLQSWFFSYDKCYTIL